jgi:hypothetical protein
VFAAGGVGAWYATSPLPGEVLVGHSLPECNAGGRGVLQHGQTFWTLTRFDDPIPGPAYELRISTAPAGGPAELLSSWTVRKKMETQDTIYFGGKAVEAVTRGRTGPMAFGVYVEDRLMAQRTFEVTAPE